MPPTPVLASVRAWLGRLLLFSPVLWSLMSPAVAAESLGSDRPMSAADAAAPAVIGFDLGGTNMVSAVVDNVTDEEPPFVRAEMNYDPVTHTPLTRTFKLGAKVRF